MENDTRLRGFRTEELIKEIGVRCANKDTMIRELLEKVQAGERR